MALVPYHGDEHNYGGPDEKRAGHVQIAQFADDELVTTGQCRVSFLITEDLHGTIIVLAAAGVFVASTSGAVTITVSRLRGGSSAAICTVTIDANELDSSTSASPPTLGNTDMETGDRVVWNVTGAGTGTEGLDVAAVFVR